MSMSVISGELRNACLKLALWNSHSDGGKSYVDMEGEEKWMP
jgi:hypothetical protein